MFISKSWKQITRISCRMHHCNYYCKWHMGLARSHILWGDMKNEITTPWFDELSYHAARHHFFVLFCRFVDGDQPHYVWIGRKEGNNLSIGMFYFGYVNKKFWELCCCMSFIMTLWIWRLWWFGQKKYMKLCCQIELI